MKPPPVRLVDRLTVERSEAIVSALSVRAPGDRVVVDCAADVSVQPGAGSRIGNALRRFSRPHGKLTIVVPRNWSTLLGRTNLGYVFAERAASVRLREAAITKKFRQAFSAIVTDNPTRHFAGALLDRGRLPLDDEAFTAVFLSWSPIAELPGRTLATNDLATVAKLVLEATQNVRDHAAKSPLAASVAVLGYCVVEYRNRDEVRFGEDGTEELSTYLEAWSGRQEIGEDLIGFLVIVVNDDGVGIAARQAQDIDIYAGEIEEELAAFGKALESGSSIKLTTNDAPVRGNPGYGYTHITGALRSLKAFASLRTGRIAASFDGLAASDAAEPREAAFDVSSVARSYMPGTALEVFVPVVHSQPSLFG